LQEKAQQELQRNEAARLAPAVIRRFVEEGGTLYASDLRYHQVLSAFPEVQFAPQQGMNPFLALGVPLGKFEVDVVDGGLRDYLGQAKIELHFDKTAWKPAIFSITKSSNLLQGRAVENQKVGNGMLDLLIGKNNQATMPPPPTVYPLLAKFKFKKGIVIFTSFHNAVQNSDIEKKLLEYLVFSLVNANTEAKLRQIMLSANFTLQDLTTVSFSANKDTHKKTYAHQGGDFQIGIGFDSLGAKFKLSLKSPSGKTIEHEESGLYLIEVPAAEVGNWEATVTSVSLPYDNFPVKLGIGRGK
jgi:hypothetical protein